MQTNGTTHNADVFDRLDLFDLVALPVEERVAYSDTLTEVIREEVKKLLASIPIVQMIQKSMARVIEKQNESSAKIVGRIEKEKSTADSEIKQVKDRLDKMDYVHDGELKEAKNQFESELKKLKEKYASLRNEIMNEILNQSRYEFGGFSPQFNDLNIGDPSVEGAWRIVKSGDNLSFQRLESGTWTEKFATTP